MSRQVTIKDVAARAGVSYQTVSKFLHNQVRVSKETEERIREAVRTTGYQPNLIARSLRSKRSRMIGYSWAPASTEQENAILDPFLHGMILAAEQAGYHILNFPHRPEEKWINKYRELIETNQVDGFVLSSVEYDDPRVKFLQDHNFPFVAFGRSNPDWEFPYVDVDGAAGMLMVVEHLIDVGHRKIAALAWSQNSRVGNNRMEGFLAALKAAGIQPVQEWIQRGEGVYQFGLEAARRLLEMPQENRPTAIVAFNDFMAIGAMHAAQAIGLRIGQELAITGFENTSICQYLSPPLTSVRQPIRQIGQQVVALLIDILLQPGSPDRHILLKPSLIIRDSSRSA